MNLNDIRLVSNLSNLSDKSKKKFNIEALSISELFFRSLKIFRIKPKNFTVLTIILGTIDLPEDSSYSIEAKGFLHKPLPFNFDEYFSLTPYNKKKLILDTIYNCLISIADKQQIDKDKLQQAYDYCIENNLENKWLLGGKLLKSPSKKYYAAIECYWETDFFQITAIVYDNKKNELFRKQLLKVAFDKPTGYLGYIYQYKPVWEVDTKNNEYLVFDIGNVFLKDQIKTKKWMINPDNQNVQTEDKEILSYLEDLEE